LLDALQQRAEVVKSYQTAVADCPSQEGVQNAFPGTT
jgi:hypothetical protein